MKKEYLFYTLLLFLFSSCSGDDDPVMPIKPPVKGSVDSVYMSRAETSFENVFKLYWSDKVTMLFRHYPNSLGTKNEPTTPMYEEHCFLWGIGGVFSAFNAIVQHTDNVDFRRKYETQLKNSLTLYHNTTKRPPAYSCFVNDHDQRLYDDALWVGIDLVDLYAKTKDSWYLEYARLVWTFVLSGKDNVLGGGVYWAENERDSKNTCSNAPAVVMGVKLFEATKDNSYLQAAQEIYDWTKRTLQDPADYLYWDCIKTSERVDKTKFSYNSGQMIQAGVLLYNATQNKQYLDDAKLVAEACYNHFFEDFNSTTGEQFRIIKDGHLWFNAIMVRGFVELNQTEENGVYITAIKKTLEHAWKNSRDPQTRLFTKELSGREAGWWSWTEEQNGKDRQYTGDILHQGAIIELYARLAVK